MKIAAIDIGSNSIHLIVVESDAIGNQRVLARETRLVRLAKGLSHSGEIAAEAFQAGLEALALMTEIARGFPCDVILACGTSVLREASNAGRFIEEAARLGIAIRVISGEEEARLIYHAANRANPHPEEPSALVNIRSGSTTITWTNGAHATESVSVPWGTQRLVEELPTMDPPSLEDLKRVSKFIRKTLKKVGGSIPNRPTRAPLVLGTSCAWLDLAKDMGVDSAFTRQQLMHHMHRLWRIITKERIDLLGVDPKRAEASHTGASWALGILDWLGAEQVRCLPVGLREGMIWEALAHGGFANSSLLERREASVVALAAKHDPDPSHSHQVSRLADRLFRDLNPTFGLGDLERELLGHAARLHDIGLSIAEKEHHKHSAYLVQKADLEGFTRTQAVIVALVARFHRGKHPSTEKHEGFAQLEPWHKTVVEKLAAILRVADALDRSRRCAVHSARISLDGDEAVLRIQGSGSLKSELESLQEKGLLLFQLLDRPVRTIVTERKD